MHFQSIMIRPASLSMSMSLSSIALHSQRRLLASAAGAAATATAPAPAAAAPLLKLHPHLLSRTARPPTEPTPLATAPHLGPSLLATRGAAADQVQHFLTPAERHFLTTMVPKAAASPKWAAHSAATADTVALSKHLGVLNGGAARVHVQDSLGQKIHDMPGPFAPAAPAAAELVAERVDMVRRILSLQAGNQAMVTRWNVQRAMEMAARKHGDTGSPEVQAAVLTVRINNLKRHLTEGKGKKDKHNARGLQGLESQRTKVLKYLKKRNLKSYYETLHKLGL